MINRIKFLISQETRFNLFLSFFLTYFKYKISKKKNQQNSDNWKNFIKKKKITIDWFSFKSFFFYLILKDKKNFSYLEIGSFEGNSLLYILENYKTANVVAVDTWQGSDEHQETSDEFSKFENNFDENLENYKHRFKKIKSTSENFFLNNKQCFDIIYIDGSHDYNDVKTDLKNSWKFLNLEGIIICDDYFFSYYENKKRLPARAINEFIYDNKDTCEVIYLTKFQIFLKKVK